MPVKGVAATVPARSRQSLHAGGVDIAADLFGVLDLKVLLSLTEEDVLGIPVRVRVRVECGG